LDEESRKKGGGVSSERGHISFVPYGEGNPRKCLVKERMMTGEAFYEF